MNTKVIIDGIVREEFGGIPWLKRSIPVHQTIDLTHVQTQEVLPLGPFLVGASFEQNGNEVDLHLVVSLMGLNLYNQNVPIVKHVGQGPQQISIGHGQLTFNGTIQVTQA